MPGQGRSEEVLEWLARLADSQPSAATWTAFTDWLERDPANAAAYQAVAEADDQLSQSRAIVLEAEPDRPAVHGDADNDNHADHAARRPWRQRVGWWGSGVAAAACAIFALVEVHPVGPSPRIETVETRPGEQRQIALNDGSAIALNGGSRLTIDRSTDRAASMEAGEAVFTIRHDAAHPFRLRTTVGEVTDVGTIFNVRLDDRRVEIGVREGAVRFGSGARAAAVDAGQRLKVDVGDGRLSLTPIGADAVGGWQRGVLEYEDARLSTVALDLSRRLGVAVQVRGDIADRRFSGIIQIDRDQPALFRSLETLVGAHATRNAAGWTLKP